MRKRTHWDNIENYGDPLVPVSTGTTFY